MTRINKWLKPGKPLALTAIILIAGLIAGCSSATPAASPGAQSSSVADPGGNPAPPANSVSGSWGLSHLDANPYGVYGNYFRSDTVVMMADGGSKALGDVRRGDLVRAAGADMVWGPREVEGIAVTAGGQTYSYSTVTYSQWGASQSITTMGGVLATADRELFPAPKLTPGMSLMGGDGVACEIQSIENGSAAFTFVGVTTASSESGVVFLDLGGLAVPQNQFKVE